MECTNIPESSGTDTPAPGDYRPHPGKPNAWIHEHTGIEVDIQRIDRRHHHEDPLPDHYEHQLWVSKPSGKSAFVERTTTNFGEGGTDNDPVAMAVDWMRDHPDGEVDLDAEALEAWERSR